MDRRGDADAEAVTETFARRRGIVWTVAHGPCDGCAKKGAVSILHVGNDGKTPECPLAALCTSCLMRALDNQASRWDTGVESSENVTPRKTARIRTREKK